MKQAYFAFCVIFLGGCGKLIYTIQNQYEEKIVAGHVVLNSDQCVEFFDFPWIGDFPIKFRYKNRYLISGKSYPPGHYIISDRGKILKQSKACPIEIIGESRLEKDEEKKPQKTKESALKTSAGEAQ